MAVPLQAGVRESSNLIAFLIQQYGKEAVLRGALAELGELEPIDCEAFAEANKLDEQVVKSICKGWPKALGPECKAAVLAYMSKWGLFHGIDKPPCDLINGKVVCHQDPMPPQPSPGPDPSPIELGQNYVVHNGEVFVKASALEGAIQSASALQSAASLQKPTTVLDALGRQTATTMKRLSGAQASSLSNGQLPAAAVFSRGVQEGRSK
jgi:hypothetical protein